jgi:outer membrane protein insertion porin family
LKVEGTNYLNTDRLIALTGLKEGSAIEIPGQELTGIMNRMWLQRKFSDVGFYIDSLSPKGDSCILVLKVQERPRVSKWLFTGVKRTEESDLIERLKLKRGGELSEYVEKSSIDIIKNYYKTPF